MEGYKAITVCHGAQTWSLESHHRTEGQEPAHGRETDGRPHWSAVEALRSKPPLALGYSNGTYFIVWLARPAIATWGLVSSWHSYCHYPAASPRTITLSKG